MSEQRQPRVGETVRYYLQTPPGGTAAVLEERKAVVLVVSRIWVNGVALVDLTVNTPNDPAFEGGAIRKAGVSYCADPSPGCWTWDSDYPEGAEV